MPLLPITLPPGMYKNGTPYSGRGRWVDGNLIRWYQDALRPIGGWTRRREDDVDVAAIVSDPDTETVRDMIAYSTNSGDAQIVFASNEALYRLTQANELSAALAVSGFTPGSNNPSQQFGYGVGPYGRGPYGTRRNPNDAANVPVQRWWLDTWGENVLAAGVNNGPIFEVTPGGAPAAIVTAPEDVAGLVVTDQRIVMVLKNDAVGGTRQVIWSDRENNTEWTSTVSNYAGDQRLQGDGLLVGAYKVQGQVLILSETDAHVARYLGAPFVYGFERIGDRCGPIHSKAVASLDRFAIWLGKRQFWLYDGTLAPVKCDVMDFIMDTMDIDAVSKMHTTTVAEFSEVWWFYQSTNSEDVDTYVVFNYAGNFWYTGNLDRTAGADAGVYPLPVMVSPNGVIYDHEQVGVIVDGEQFALSGPLELGGGAKNMAVRYVFPDTQEEGSVLLKFFARQMPTSDAVEFGPFEYNNPISTTGVMGRQIQMQVEPVQAKWEVGTMRFDVQAIGGGFR